MKVPQCLDDLSVHRWSSQIGMDVIHGLPMWKPETLLCYMAARPSRISWEDIQEWLWAVCENLDLDLLLAELEGRPRAVWMKTAYLADVGERPDQRPWSLFAGMAGATLSNLGVGKPRAGTQI